MPAIPSLMKRLGFVKLRDYGLVLTPEDRILSIRPAVLDDGLGGRIVGWTDGDLAAAELERWAGHGARPAARPAVASRVAAPPPPKLVAKPAIAPPRTPDVAPPRQAEVAPAPRADVSRTGVAPAPVVDEDDWEGTIAIARARAAAEEAEHAAAQAPPLTLPIKVAAPVSRDSWETQPIVAFDVSDYTSPTIQVLREPATKAPPATREPTPAAVPSLAHAKAVIKSAPVDVKAPPPLGIPTPPRPFAAVQPPRVYSRAPSPVTVIPIPKLPKSEPSRLAPVVRPIAQDVAIPSIAPRRLAKGTGPVTPPRALPRTPAVEHPVGDQTHPGLILPRAAQR